MSTQEPLEKHLSGKAQGRIHARGYLWTEEEDRFLFENAKRLTAVQIGRHIGRSKSAVCGHARRLGISLHAFGKRYGHGRIRGNPKATRSPTALDIAWIAGFLEGEGSFSVNEHPHGIWGQLKVSATQAQLEPIQKLRAMLGGSVSTYKGSKLGKKTLWTWAACGVRAFGIMLTLYSMLSPNRRRQIDKAIAWCRQRQEERNRAYAARET